MKKILIVISLLAFAISSVSCLQPESELVFGVKDVDGVSLENGTLKVGPEGGRHVVKITSSEKWVAETQYPWITISPANGVGSTDCEIIVDSALVALESRQGAVRFKTMESDKSQKFTVNQSGFDLILNPAKTSIELESYAELEDRKFTIVVNTNVPFTVEAPKFEDKPWIEYKVSELVLDRKDRPRNARVNFTWELNPTQSARQAEFKLIPSDPSMEARVIAISQKPADEIGIGVRGDSLALLAISRVLGCWREFDTAEKMENWDGVTVHKSGPNKGRVRSAQFYLFGTKEPLPFQVKYLTAAEELYFYSNENSFRYSLSTGKHICELTQLRKLTIGAYGLTELPDEFANLKNLEYLDISGNNFEEIPAVLSPENLPNLTALIINANQRNVSGDLFNNYKENSGGLINECPLREDGTREFPRRLLKWNKLDTLRLSVNYLQGTIPDLMDDPDFPKWTAEEVNACDTLPAKLIGLPKVLPDTDFLAINLNRLHGELPDWLLYHPKLDLWYPFQLIFLQEGKDREGNVAGFSNEPANLNYYYEEYKNKKYNPNN